jgi:hypothetical protein
MVVVALDFCTCGICSAVAVAVVVAVAVAVAVTVVEPLLIYTSVHFLVYLCPH